MQSGLLVAVSQAYMYAFRYAFRYAQGAIPSLKPALGSINFDNTTLISKQFANDSLAQVPHFRYFLDRVVLLESTHSRSELYSLGEDRTWGMR